MRKRQGKKKRKTENDVEKMKGKKNKVDDKRNNNRRQTQEDWRQAK